MNILCVNVRILPLLPEDVEDDAPDLIETIRRWWQIVLDRLVQGLELQTQSAQSELRSLPGIVRETSRCVCAYVVARHRRVHVMLHVKVHMPVPKPHDPLRPAERVEYR